MMFAINELNQSTVWQLYRMRGAIDFDPDYQRLSDIWTLDKRQLLIDTILNRFDVPKLYLHRFISPKRKNGHAHEYAIVDGKQRLEAVFAFIEGKFGLANNFEYIADETIEISGSTYEELGKFNPDLKADFDGYRLNVICIETNDIELIEDMFSRLNEAVPLSAPEKRNAFGGPLPVAIRRLSKESFFETCLPFANSRYRHFDLATKFLYFERKSGITDTKKAYLDEFVREYSEQPKSKSLSFLKSCQLTVAQMRRVFTNKDSLLRQVGMVSLFYLLFQKAHREGWLSEITRKRIVDFERHRLQNRKIAEESIAGADYELLEFDRLSQSPNDAFALEFRLRVLLKRAFKKES
jgi:Protein of unknown function DUF262